MSYTPYSIFHIKRITLQTHYDYSEVNYREIFRKTHSCWPRFSLVTLLIEIDCDCIHNVSIYGCEVKIEYMIYTYICMICNSPFNYNFYFSFNQTTKIHENLENITQKSISMGSFLTIRPQCFSTAIFGLLNFIPFVWFWMLILA